MLRGHHVQSPSGLQSPGKMQALYHRKSRLSPNLLLKIAAKVEDGKFMNRVRILSVRAATWDLWVNQICCLIDCY